ncbi:general secretion pathway protein GspL [Seongchinamella sediminis]|uniref:General secretion pathway protein GspL n=1 Tax=Seongchinamella sediminis TaxID=2283635 RepID=A0A3L7E2C7_9GAMM|nr:PilN domain-containing protein [Seongchinamella sediminis]RLQ23686.1 general secretion pathway protein GspL [Seongchinamella sediminis]
MFESGQNWELFGYDMRNLGKHFNAAWRDLLWAYDSPLRSRLDEPVELRTPSGTASYQAGQPCAKARTDCSAVLLPEELALTRALRLPLAVEADLEEVLALEVNSSSPFAAADTGYGWALVARDDQFLQVALVIVSLSSAMTYIGHQYDSHDAQAQEVWVDVEGRMVVIRGFGEGRRQECYRRRLFRVGAMLAATALVLLLIVAAGAGFKKLELERLEQIAAVAASDAEQATRMRNTLGAANATTLAVDAVSSLYPSPHLELARLSRLLADDAYVERLSINGREIDLRGRAVDAAAIMQLLSKQPEYATVTTASAIRKIAGTDLEQFHLKIQLQEAVI